MASKEESNEKTATGQDPPDAAEGKKSYRKRKELPPLSDMLAYGSPESQGKPKTWWDILWGPLTLAILFAISFFIFMNAPHDKSRYATGRFKLPQNKRPPPKVLQKHEPQVPMTQKGGVDFPEAQDVSKHEPVPFDADEKEEFVEAEEATEQLSEGETRVPMTHKIDANSIPEGHDVHKHEPVPLEPDASEKDTAQSSSNIENAHAAQREIPHPEEEEPKFPEAKEVRKNEPVPLESDSDVAGDEL